MRYLRNAFLLNVIFFIVMIFGISQTAQAAGTASGTDIDNRATINYDVGAIPQTLIESSPTGNSTPGATNGADTTFKVDNKVDLTVTTIDVAAVQVTPGSSDQVLTLSVLNAGNTVQDYSLTATAAAGPVFGVTDTFDATSVTVFVEDGVTAGYQVAEDTETYIDELAADGTSTVYIVSDIPVAQSDGDGAAYDLNVQTAVGGTPASQGADITTDHAGDLDDPAVVQIVFADGAGTNDAANDGKHSSDDIYEVASSALTITKTSLVITDPINGASNPKAIPGATLRYTITVANTGGTDADNVVIVDSIPTNCTYAAGTIVLDAASKTDADDADEADFNVTNAGAVTVAVGTVVATTGSSTTTFDVTVD